MNKVSRPNALYVKPIDYAKIIKENLQIIEIEDRVEKMK